MNRPGMQTSPWFVGLDVGGSSMKAGVVDDAGRPLGTATLPTEANKGQERGLRRMAATIRQAVESADLSIKEIAAIGVATPGTMDIPAGIILDPPNLKPWRNVPVRSFIEETFGLPTAFQNDANAAALGEYWVGAGRGAHSLVLFTLGTGIGGGIIIDGQIVDGRHSHGAELGHQRIEITNPRLCGCGRRGCLEAYASAISVVKRMQEALERNGSARKPEWVLRKKRDLSAKDVFTAADRGDELAVRIVEETAFYLAVGATNAMHTIDPDVVVFAGGMIAAGEPFLKRIRHHVKKLAFPVPAKRTRIVYAELGVDAGFIGAAACGRQLYYRRAQGDPANAHRAHSDAAKSSR